jgi:hypothetical protein
MKYLFLVFGITTLLVSCKKTYRCECREVLNGEDWNPIITNIAIEDKKEKDAKTLCESFNYTISWQAYKTCSIK